MELGLFLVFEETGLNRYEPRPVRATNADEAACLYANARFPNDDHHTKLEIGVVEYYDNPYMLGIPHTKTGKTVFVHVRDRKWVLYKG